MNWKLIALVLAGFILCGWSIVTIPGTRSQPNFHILTLDDGKRCVAVSNGNTGYNLSCEWECYAAKAERDK